MGRYHTDLAGEIRARVPVWEAAERYGFPRNRAGYICCPFHSEKTASCKLYEDGFHCFGCGAHGTVIDLVMGLFGISFSQALVRLDSDFGLGLTSLKPDPGQREKLREREAARREAERRRNEISREMKELTEEYRRMHANVVIYEPSGPDIEDFHPLFAQALRGLAALDWRLEELENKWKELGPCRKR